MDCIVSTEDQMKMLLLETTDLLLNKQIPKVVVLSHRRYMLLHLQMVALMIQAVTLHERIYCWSLDRINLRVLKNMAFFLYFSKSFFTEIYFRFHNLQIYTPTARLRGGRPPVGR